MVGEVHLRFYAELREYLEVRGGDVVRRFDGSPSVEDVIQACGVPHTEIDLVLVNGEPVDFSHQIEPGDRVSVYPVFETFDIGPVTRVRAQPLRSPRFVLDAHLGRLAGYLRRLGFDADHSPDRAAPQLVRISIDERRILLSRDQDLLKHRELTHAYFVRSTDPRHQLKEVVRHFQLEG